MDGNTLTMVLYFGGFIVIFYVFLILPRKKQEKKHNQLIESLKKGEKIVTIGGIKGEITKVREKTFLIKVSENSEMEFLKTAIAYRADEVQ